MRKYVIAACAGVVASVTLVSWGANQDSTAAYQHMEEISSSTETEKPTGYEMSSEDNSENTVDQSSSTENSQSVVLQRSLVTQEPQATQAPVATQEPQATQVPVLMQDPLCTRKPVVIPIPQATQKPQVTQTPQATQKPQATKTPQATQKPQVTQKPQATQIPQVTQIPQATKTPSPTKAPTATTTPGSSSSSNKEAYIAQVLEIINEERAKNGLSALTTNATLQKAAQKRAQEIVTNFSHTRPDGTSGVTVLKDYGISYRAWGENIAYGQKTPSAVMNAWMNSSGHRANILSTKFGKVGIGCYEKNGVLYWTQVFTD